jgi:predicted phage-related endonuclease
MVLSAEDRALRKLSIGGSDANIIMSGDADKILKLWKEKVGETEPEDLSDILPVQLGSFTEPFNIEWFTKTTGRVVTNQQERHVHAKHTFMTCTLDGMTDGGKAVFEAKHVGQFMKEDEILDRYAPQLHHNMSVMGVEWAVLSVLFGNQRHEVMDVNYDPLYGSTVEHMVAKFWDAVQTKTPPTPTDRISFGPPVRRVDMTGNNHWASLADQWRTNAPYVKLYDEAVDGLKGLVDPDVMEAYGHGISIKRDKRGALRMKGA